ncbi:hypothetical protein [Mycoplasma parvum]|uniref:Uncharacterized protein n=1 Tax=Mycoplasma parvum str. Indiana TaxID=1403316 RepID=U5NCD1_9MOLU|nr:hypothetical protein [Mycoplasma parvum]AGX89241.1 hypothetical protein PRV_02525 [Mycoplasma parvum str. Indiana]
MFLKSFFTLVLGSGVGAPLMITMKKIFEMDLMPAVLRNSEIKAEIKWSKKNSKNNVGALIDKLGETRIAKKQEKSNNTVILGVVLTTSIPFENKICKSLGFDSNLGNNIKNEEGRRVICETNLDRKEALSKGNK